MKFPSQFFKEDGQLSRIGIAWLNYGTNIRPNILRHSSFGLMYSEEIEFTEKPSLVDPNNNDDLEP